MLRENDVAKIRLDAVQTFFILKRLLGDLALVARGTENARSTVRMMSEETRPSSVSYDDSGSTVSFIQTRLSLVRPFAKMGPSAPPPCSPETDAQGVILDYRALGITTAFGKVAERLGGRLGKYAKGAGFANLIAALLKVIATYALVKAEITINGHPLERTQDTHAGKDKTLTAKLEIDSDKWQMINCFRPALNAAGLDFNLPDAGPIADVQVVWKQIEGGDSRGALGTIVDIPTILRGEAAWGNGIVFLDPLPGADRSPAKQRTDANGISQMKVVGVPQARDLSKEKLTKVNKVAGVKIGIQLKTMRITDATKLASTLGDMAGNVISFWTGDIAGGIVGTIAETLYRSNWYSSQPFYFLVTDWEPCAGLWQGTMTTTTIVETHTTENGKTGDFTRKFDSSYRFEGTVRFEGAKATATIETAESISDDQKSGYGRITDQQKWSGNFQGEVEAAASVSNGRYSVHFELPKIYGTYQSSGSCERPAPLKCQQPQTIAKPWEFNDSRYLSHVSGDVDPNKPNEINDTKVLELGSLQHTITVNLKRCQ